MVFVISTALLTFYFSCHMPNDYQQKIIASGFLPQINPDSAFYNCMLCEKRNVALEKENSALQKITIISVIFSAILLALLISLILFQRHQKTKLKGKIDFVNESLERLKSLEEDHMRLEEKRHSADIKITGSEIYKKIKTVIESEGKETFLEWQSLSDTVSNIFPMFRPNILKLRKMSSIELRVCLLLKMGLTVPDVSRIVCRSQDTVYSICRRLYKKNFEDSPSAKKWKDFIQSL